MPSRAEQQAPPPPSIPGLTGPRANDEPSGAEQSSAPAGSDPKRAEQSQSENTPPPLTDEYLDVTGGCSGECNGWRRVDDPSIRGCGKPTCQAPSHEARCSGCGNPAVPGATRCQHCIDHNPPQNYQQLKERYPELPVQRLGEARRFA